MRLRRTAAGHRLVVLCLMAVLATSAARAAHAAGTFPFEQELMLDARPMPPSRRMPVLTVSEDGRATIDLWCRTVVARVQVSDGAIKIESAPLSTALPQYMSQGQCSEARMQADTDLLVALSRMTEWRAQGGGVVLSGTNTSGADLNAPAPLRFRPSNH